MPSATRSTPATASGAASAATEMDTTAAEIADEIRAAFEDIELPDPPVTEESYGPLGRPVEEALAGKRADKAFTHDDALAVRLDLWALTPEAYRYYVPALVRMLLVGGGGGEVDALGEGVMTVLTPPSEAERRERFDTRIALLDDAQRKAAADFVCWWLSDPEGEHVANRAELVAYWQCG